MTATDASINITFPQPCVVFLKSTANTPKSLTWNIDFFDGQKVTLEVPVIRLADLGVKEIAKRDLLPIGQFYLRTFEPLTKRNTENFRESAASLLTELKIAVEEKTVPYHIGIQMQETIRKTLENCVAKADKEVDVAVTTNIVETLPWIDYGEVFRKLEERGKVEGRAEGKAEGRTERDMEITRKMFDSQKPGANLSALTKTLRDLGISDEIIESARKQYEAGRNRQGKNRTERER